MNCLPELRALRADLLNGKAGARIAIASRVPCGCRQIAEKSAPELLHAIAQPVIHLIKTIHNNTVN